MTWDGKSGRIEDVKQPPWPGKQPEEKQPPKEQPKETGGEWKVQGLDVSRYQTHVNWRKAKELGFEFVIAKATDGAGGIDAMFSKHMDGSHEAGLIRGAYCFNRFASDPKTQAEVFARTAENHTRFLVLDVEWDRSSSTKAKFGDKYGDDGKMDEYAASHALKCLERLEQLGFHPLIYSNTYFFLGFSNPERFSRFPYWASNYQQKTKQVAELDVTKVPLPKPYKECAIWQWTDKSIHARAIVGEDNLDTNVSFMSIDALKEWGMR